jgi:hypothetical protein
MVGSTVVLQIIVALRRRFVSLGKRDTVHRIRPRNRRPENEQAQEATTRIALPLPTIVGQADLFASLRKINDSTTIPKLISNWFGSASATLRWTSMRHFQNYWRSRAEGRQRFRYAQKDFRTEQAD